MTTTRNTFLAFLVILFGLGQFAAQAQTSTITGTVTDSTTLQALVGAAVAIEGTQRGTTVGANGEFTLTGLVAGTYRVTARYIGYAPITHEVTVRDRSEATLSFALPRQAMVMDEIVVTGYGAQRRVAITGSVASVQAEDANVGVVTNADEMLQGRVAGVTVTQNSGEPGSGTQIRVRGGTSISAGNEPLYVIDGVAISNLSTEAEGVGVGGDASLARNPLSLINPNDIESITVLKDAAAAAIYGARGANGVILIETRQGQRDQTSFEYDGYVSVASRARSLNLVTGDQYRQFVEAQVAAGTVDPARLDGLGSASTDWENEVTRSALVQNHNFAFSGGTQSTQYRASLNYMDQEGVTRGSGFKRYQGRLNGTQYAWDDKLQLRLNLTASHMEHDYVTYQDGGGFEGAVFQNMVQFNPTQPVTVTDTATGQQKFYEIGPGAVSVRNPVAMIDQLTDLAGTTRVLGNVRAQLDFTRTFSAQMVVGADRSESTRRIYYPSESPVGAQWNGRAVQRSLELTSLTFQGVLTWGDRIGLDHDIEVVAGYEANEFDRDQFSAESRDFLTDAFRFDNLAAGNELLPQASFREEKRLIGIFGRVNYGFKDRYFLTGVIRRDGSSVFGADNKWGTFPAISGSWRLSEESFMYNTPFSELRLRAGYGLQGNEAVAPYQSLITLSPGDRYVFGQSPVVGVAPNQNPNPDLKWERTSQFNVALDYGFMDNRLTGSFEYYVKNTDDLLLEVVVPQPAAVERRLENIGKVKNTGFEAIVDWLITNRANLTWTAGLVFAAEKNEVTDLGGLNFITTGFVSGQGQSGQVSQRILPGYALGTFYGPEFIGHNAAGEQLFNQYSVERDSAGRETSRTLTGQTTTPGGDDFVPIGNANPSWEMGLRTGLTFGGFDMSLLLRAKVGLDVFNNTALVYGTKSNVLQDKNFLASAIDDSTGITQPAIYSSRWIEDASYLRLSNIVLGYTFQLPGAFVGAGSMARLYVAADNLFLITGYTGYDPEAHTDRGNLAVRGVDYLSYPRARAFTFGLRLTF